MSAVLIFEIKGAKNFQLYKGPFLRNGWPLYIWFFACFSEIYAKFRKNITSQIFLRHSKNFNILNVIIAEKSTALNKTTGRVGAAKLDAPNATL